MHTETAEIHRLSVHLRVFIGRTIQSWLTVKKRQHKEIYADNSSVCVNIGGLYLFTSIAIMA